MITNPNLQWRVLIGKEEMTLSSVRYNSRNARWSATDQAELVVSDKDRIRVEVRHIGMEGAPRVLGVWEGFVYELPMEGKGLTKLRMESPDRNGGGSVKRVMISVEE